MNKSFSFVVDACRAQGARIAEWIESLIIQEIFNQPLRLVYSTIQGTKHGPTSVTGLYNTLSPYMFDAQYHFTPAMTYIGKETDDMDTNQNKQHELHDLMSHDIHTEKAEQDALVQNRVTGENRIADPGVVGSEILPTQPVTTETFGEDVFIKETKSNSTEPLALKKDKKKKQKKTYATKGMSMFALWLLEQKSLEGSKTHWPKKTSKKNKINESAQKSITPSDEIVSESLAIILKKQGHYLESKKMYKKLIIKFPEKTNDYILEIEQLNTLL